MHMRLVAVVGDAIRHLDCRPNEAASAQDVWLVNHLLNALFTWEAGYRALGLLIVASIITNGFPCLSPRYWRWINSTCD